MSIDPSNLSTDERKMLLAILRKPGLLREAEPTAPPRRSMRKRVQNLDVTASDAAVRSPMPDAGKFRPTDGSKKPLQIGPRPTTEIG